MAGFFHLLFESCAGAPKRNEINSSRNMVQGNRVRAVEKIDLSAVTDDGLDLFYWRKLEESKVGDKLPKVMINPFGKEKSRDDILYKARVPENVHNYNFHIQIHPPSVAKAQQHVPFPSQPPSASITQPPPQFSRPIPVVSTARPASVSMDPVSEFECLQTSSSESIAQSPPSFPSQQPATPVTRPPPQFSHPRRNVSTTQAAPSIQCQQTSSFETMAQSPPKLSSQSSSASKTRSPQRFSRPTTIISTARPATVSMEPVLEFECQETSSCESIAQSPPSFSSQKPSTSEKHPPPRFSSPTSIFSTPPLKPSASMEPVPELQSQQTSSSKLMAQSAPPLPSQPPSTSVTWPPRQFSCQTHIVSTARPAIVSMEPVPEFECRQTSSCESITQSPPSFPSQKYSTSEAQPPPGFSRPMSKFLTPRPATPLKSSVSVEPVPELQCQGTSSSEIMAQSAPPLPSQQPSGSSSRPPRQFSRRTSIVSTARPATVLVEPVPGFEFLQTSSCESIAQSTLSFASQPPSTPVTRPPPQVSRPIGNVSATHAAPLLKPSVLVEPVPEVQCWKTSSFETMPQSPPPLLSQPPSSVIRPPQQFSRPTPIVPIARPAPLLKPLVSVEPVPEFQCLQTSSSESIARSPHSFLSEQPSVMVVRAPTFDLLVPQLSEFPDSQTSQLTSFAGPFPLFPSQPPVLVPFTSTSDSLVLQLPKLPDSRTALPTSFSGAPPSCQSERHSVSIAQSLGMHTSPSISGIRSSPLTLSNIDSISEAQKPSQISSLSPSIPIVSPLPKLSIPQISPSTTTALPPPSPSSVVTSWLNITETRKETLLPPLSTYPSNTDSLVHLPPLLPIQSTSAPDKIEPTVMEKSIYPLSQTVTSKNKIPKPPPPPPLPPTSSKRFPAPPSLPTMPARRNSSRQHSTSKTVRLTPSISKQCLARRNTIINNLEGKSTKETKSEPGEVKLKPLHWDKVVANTDHSMIWDEISNGSFMFDDALMETLFGYPAASQRPRIKSTVTPGSHGPNSVVSTQIFILEPRKSQNIAIVLKSLTISRKEIIEALLSGQEVDGDVLEKLTKISPKKEEIEKILQFDGNPTKLADAESFLYHILKSVPSAFSRIEAMLFRTHYEPEILHHKKSLQTLESACNQLRNRGIFLKLLKAILKAGNMMNAGTSRGNAQGFNLTVLRKLSDVRSADRQTTLLHFVVEQVIRSEGKHCMANQNLLINTDANEQMKFSSESDSLKEQEERNKQYLMLGLPVLRGLSAELCDVKKAATLDFGTFINACSSLSTRVVEIQRSVTSYSGQVGGFVMEMKGFLEQCVEELKVVKEEQTRVVRVVEKTTDYYQAGSSKDKGANPFHIFVIVKDFLDMVDQVCLDITRKVQRKSTTAGVGLQPSLLPLTRQNMV